MNKIIKNLERFRLPLAILISLLLAYFLASYFFPRPQVGIINIRTPIYPPYSNSIIEMIRYAKEEPSISAVVLKIDSPGGEAAPSEEIYMEVLSLREKKPVVVSFGGLGASGAYYVSAASNYIYAVPSSLIGSIGAYVTAPSESAVENVRKTTVSIDTGPYKSTELKGDVLVKLDNLFRNFLSAVRSQRGGKLKLNDAELAKGRLYIGTEAVAHGLIDEIGPTSRAIEKAAELGGIRDYTVVDVNEKVGFAQAIIFFEANSSAPGYYYLYILGELK